MNSLHHSTKMSDWKMKNLNKKQKYILAFVLTPVVWLLTFALIAAGERMGLLAAETINEAISQASPRQIGITFTFLAASVFGIVVYGLISILKPSKNGNL